MKPMFVDLLKAYSARRARLTAALEETGRLRQWHARATVAPFVGLLGLLSSLPLLYPMVDSDLDYGQ